MCSVVPMPSSDKDGTVFANISLAQGSKAFKKAHEVAPLLSSAPGATSDGGAGVRRIVAARDSEDEVIWCLKDKYWTTTIFSLHGRALPLRQWLLYMAYVSLVVPLLIYLVPNVASNNELRGLQFPMTALGTALFLLMAFRTNSCYDRWWEGRKIFGSMVIRCQDMGRVALGRLASKDAALAAQIVRLTIAYSVIFKKWLRKDSDYSTELQGVLPDEQLDELSQEAQPVVAVVTALTQVVDQASDLLRQATHAHLEAQMMGMIADALGCARIVGTPMPFAYIVHLRSFMLLWLIAIPYAFLPYIGYWTVLICGVVAYQLLGFEDIGVEIEQPFGTDYNDLPVDQMGAALFNQLLAVLHKIEDQGGGAGGRPYAV